MKCSNCNGKGRFGAFPLFLNCARCNGTGSINTPPAPTEEFPEPEAPLMPSMDQCKAFLFDLNKLIDRYRYEFDLTYPQVVGALHIVAADLCADANRKPVDG